MTKTDRFTLAFCGACITFAAYALVRPLIPEAIAKAETQLFVASNLRDVREFPDRYALLEHGLRSVKADGLYCEFGVYRGDSINFIAERIGDKIIHGFDSFEGLPEKWRDEFPQGYFKVPGLPPVRGNVLLYKGWFADSLPKWAHENPGAVAFAHMDADLYSSTSDVFRIIGERFVPGSVVAFDELIGYPGWPDGEFRALRELVAARHLRYEYLGYSKEQVSIRLIQ